jgi:hypothetical protein
LGTHREVTNFGMSVVFNLKDIGPNEVKQIQTQLIIIPVDPKEEKRKKWKFAPKVYTAPKDPLRCFQIEGEKDKEIIRLPFRYACSLYNKVFNQDNPYPVVRDPIDKDANGQPTNSKCHIVLRDKQPEYCKQLLEQMQTYGTTTLGNPTGDGKTVMAAWLWQYSQLVACFVVPVVGLMDSWYSIMATGYPNLKPYIWRVGVDPEPSNGFIPPIIITYDGRIDKIPKYIRVAVGYLVLDEMHMMCTQTRPDELLQFQPKNIVLCSATFVKPNQLHQFGLAIGGTHGVFPLPTKPYTVIKLRTGIHVEETKNTFGVNFVDLTNKLIDSVERQNIIYQIVAQNLHRKFIVMSRFTELPKKLSLGFNAMGIKNATLFGDQDTYSDSPVLLGTVPKMGTGFDEKNFCPDFKGRASDTEILATTFSEDNLPLYIQVAGRVMRSNDPYIIYMVDEHAICKRHFKAIEEWVYKTNGRIIEVYWSAGGFVLPHPPPPPTQLVIES